MRIAVAGKGGTGKTTIAGTLARVLARREQQREVIAIDADTNPNLASVLGIPAAQEFISLPRNLLKRTTNADGTVTVSFDADPDDVLREYGIVGPDRVRLMVMGKVGHGGAG